MRPEGLVLCQSHLSNLGEAGYQNKFTAMLCPALLLTFLGQMASIQLQAASFRTVVRTVVRTHGWADMALSAGARFAASEWLSVNTAASTDTHDETLVRAAKGGDRAAFGHLYQRYIRMVYGILLARVPRSAAEDLVHDVFLQALSKLTALRDASRFGPWLAAITRNRATDFHRRAKPGSALNDEAGAVEALENHRSEIGLEEGIALLNALRDLPEAYREPLILRFVEGMSGPEIAERTGLTHGSVRVNLHRGTQLLREKWQRIAPRAEERSEKEKGS
jgi:RNA polymerase sigma-70 factor (ECF subfamily)